MKPLSLLRASRSALFGCVYKWLGSVARAELCVRQSRLVPAKSNALSTTHGLAQNDTLALSLSLSKNDCKLAQIAQSPANSTAGME